MKRGGAVTMGALAGLSLAAAYVTWQRPKETKRETDVTVLDASKTSLQKIHYDDGTRYTELTRTVEAESVVWLKQGYLEGKEPAYDAGPPPAPVDAGTLPDGGVAPAPPPPFVPPPPPPTRELKGNERADKTWEKFTPFEAVRALGALPEAKLKELGLDNTQKLLEVTVAGTPRRFRVSNPATGFIGQYLLDEKTKDVYLLASGQLSEIEPGSTALVDRRLHAFKATDYDSFVVTVDNQKKEFVQTDAAIPQTTKVAPKDAPDKPDEFAKNWHDKIWNRLIVTEVLGKGETPPKGEPKVMLKVEYFSKGRPKGWLELARGEGTQVYGKSENTAGWVGLHAGVEEMALEAKKLVSGK
jgi:hypothetical protein